MSEVKSPTDIGSRESIPALMIRLQEAGAHKADAVGWYYVQTLAERIRRQPDSIQRLLEPRLCQALLALQARLNQRPLSENDRSASPSPMAALLQDMGSAPCWHVQNAPPHLHESPRVSQLRQQLLRISVQKQVSHAMARGPQNAGPINSHMLVLRALGLLREIAPDYLSRFMVHLDTLLCLEQGQTPTSAMPARTTRGRKPGAGQPKR